MMAVADRLIGWTRRVLRGSAAPVAQEAAPAPQARPLAAFDVYAGKARALGLREPTLFLSFDADTPLDPPAAVEVMRFLGGLGIKATFAVPGTELENAAATYRRLADDGVEFMNHGYLPHAEWREDRYAGITFYETMELAAVDADIRRGDAAVRAVTASAPRGFRAPHFGHFKQPDQLAFKHAIAAELGYAYCSTTLPEYGLEHGPVHEVLPDLVELPTFGSSASPTSVLDSWTYLADRRDYALSDTYADLLVETVDALFDHEIPALLTWYADPCHVAGQAPFERAMQHLAARRVASLTGTEAARLGRSR